MRNLLFFNQAEIAPKPIDVIDQLAMTQTQSRDV